MNEGIKKILVVHKFSGFCGGIERYIFDTSQLLRLHGFELHGFFEERLEHNSAVFEKAFDSISFVEKEKLEQQILKYRDLGIRHAFIHKATSTELLKILQKYLITTLFVHDHDYYCMRFHKYYSFGRANCRRPFNTLVCTVCDRPLYRNEEGKIRFKAMMPFSKRAIFLASRNCHSFVVLSEHMRNNLIINKYPQDKIYKIYPVIKNKDIRSVPKSNNQLLFVGQIIRGKGVDLLLESLKYLKNDYNLNIVGKGNDESYIKELIAKQHLKGKVTMVPFTLEISKYYEESSIVLVPSRWQEPFGLIGGEAYSHYRPVVAFDVGGISEWLENEINGFLVRENDVKTFAEKIDLLIDHPDQALKMGESGNQMNRLKFNEKNYVESIIKLIGK